MEIMNIDSVDSLSNYLFSTVLQWFFLGFLLGYFPRKLKRLFFNIKYWYLYRKYIDHSELDLIKEVNIIYDGEI